MRVNERVSVTMCTCVVSTCMGVKERVNVTMCESACEYARG